MGSAVCLLARPRAKEKSQLHTTPDTYQTLARGFDRRKGEGLETRSRWTVPPIGPANWDGSGHQSTHRVKDEKCGRGENKKSPPRPTLALTHSRAHAHHQPAAWLLLVLKNRQSTISSLLCPSISSLDLASTFSGGGGQLLASPLATLIRRL